MTGKADWLAVCRGEILCNLSAGKSSRAIIQKRDLKLVNASAALAEFFLSVVLLKKEKLL